MVVAGEEDVDAGVLGRLERERGALERAADDRVVGDEDAQRAGVALGEAGDLADAVGLQAAGDLAAGGVEAEDAQAGSGQQRRLDARDQAVVAADRDQDAADQVVERDVVVAGDGQPRGVERVQERASAAELTGAGALGEVAADDDELRLDLLQRPQERVYGARRVPTEVRVGDVREDDFRQRRVRRRCP